MRLPGTKGEVKQNSTPFMRFVASMKGGVQYSLVTLKIVHRPGENRRKSGHVHVNRLAVIQFSRIKLVNLKKGKPK